MRIPGFFFSRRTLVSLILTYLLMVVLMFLLAHRAITRIPFSTGPAGTFLLLSGLAFFLAVLVVLGAYVVKALQEVRARKPGIFLKLRLILLFSFLTLVASVPQGLLAINVIREVIGGWFQMGVTEALQSGVNFAVSYYTERVELLGRVNNHPLYLESLQQDEPEKTWRLLRSLYQEISSFEIIQEGRRVFWAGEPSLLLSSPEEEENLTSPVTRESIEGLTVLRVRRVFERDSTVYLAVISLSMPPWYVDQSNRLTELRDRFLLLDRYQGPFLLSLTLFYGFFALPLVFLALLLGFLLSDDFLKPLIQLEHDMRRIAAGELSFRPTFTPRSEIAFLIRAFATMLTELERNREKLLQAEKIATWQDIAQQLAHEIKNPLTPIRLAAERIRRKAEGVEDEALQRVLDQSTQIILHEVNRLTRLLEEFRDFSRLREPTLTPCNLRSLLSHILSSYDAPETPYRFHLDTPEDIVIQADEEHLKQALGNLIQNAIDAGAGKEQTITVRLLRTSRDGRSYATIEIRDEGHGIPEDQQRLVFLPYYTTKRQGTGLGLAIVQRIVLDHNGKIWFTSEVGKGSTFYIELPVEP